MIAAFTWLALATSLNLAWEFAHLPLHKLAPGVDPTAAVLHCAAGDAPIAAACYTAVVLALRTPRWSTRRPFAGRAVFIALAATYTIESELRNLASGAWAYANPMPTLAGIGVSPLVQWWRIPTIATCAYRVLRRSQAS